VTSERITLTYFDFPGGRGEDCRLALYIGGLDFEDDRVAYTRWKEVKGRMPFGALPVLRVEGRGEIAQSNAILRWVGNRTGLHPTDAWEAARHDMLMDVAEDLRHQLEPSLRIADPEQKRAAREALAAGAIPTWARRVEAHVRGPFVAGDALHVVDLKLAILMQWFVTGKLDYIAPTVFEPYAKLTRLYAAVEAHPKVREWATRSSR
jgi:glutathione S-transferase